jgi:hypothetical protein
VAAVAPRVSSSKPFCSVLPSAHGIPSGNPSVGLMRPLARGPFAFGRLLPMRGSWKDECWVCVREMGTSALSMQALGDVSAEGWGRVVLLSEEMLSVYDLERSLYGEVEGDSRR